ncbi:phosphoglycerate mutase, partial [Lacticaseibacillus paracasei subsp. paracasei CNCM I-4649]
MTTNLYLVRHGQTIFNNERRVQGSADSGLTDKAVKDAVKLGQWFSKNNVIFDAIFSSDLPRAIHSAKLILQQQSNFKEKTLLDCYDLRELNYGHYEGWHVDRLCKDRIWTAKLQCGYFR